MLISNHINSVVTNPSYNEIIQKPLIVYVVVTVNQKFLIKLILKMNCHFLDCNSNDLANTYTPKNLNWSAENINYGNCFRLFLKASATGRHWILSRLWLLDQRDGILQFMKVILDFSNLACITFVIFWIFLWVARRTKLSKLTYYLQSLTSFGITLGAQSNIYFSVLINEKFVPKTLTCFKGYNLVTIIFNAFQNNKWNLKACQWEVIIFLGSLYQFV